jgi:hypothetical protein
MTSNVSNTTLFYDTLTIPYVNTLQLTAPSIISRGGVSLFSNLIVSNLQVTNTLIITATNTQTTNSLSIINQGTATALYVNQNEFPNMTYNVAEFWDHTQLAMVIDGYGNVAVHTASSPGYAFTVVDGAKIDKLTVSGSLIASGAALSSLNASNITTGILSSTLIYGNTLSNISGSNVTTGINASNITTGILSSSLIYGNTLSNIQSSNITQPFANLAVSNSVTTANITATRGMGVGTYAGSAAPANGLIVSGNTGIGTNSPGYLLDVAGYMRSVAIVDSTSSIGSAGQVLTSTGSSLQWAPGFTQPLANLVVSNTVTTSEIICNAFTTSTTKNWNYVSNAVAARSTSVGWNGIRQVFGDHVSQTIYVYNNAVLEATLSYGHPNGFAMFVAIGGATDNIIVTSGVDTFYVYHFNGSSWIGPAVVDTTASLGENNTLWMPSLSAGTLVTLVIGGYGWGSPPQPSEGNPKVGIYTILVSDGSTTFVGTITPLNDMAVRNRNTVAVSGDGRTIAIGQQDSSQLYVYTISDLLSPVFSSGMTLPSPEYYVSIDYDGQIVLLTLQDFRQVLMYSISLSPV